MFLDGTMKHHCYFEILWEQLLPRVTPVFGHSLVFVQDNLLSHAERETTVFPELSGVEVMYWLVGIPDMNVVQHLWCEMPDRWTLTFQCCISTTDSRSTMVRRPETAQGPGGEHASFNTEACSVIQNPGCIVFLLLTFMIWFCIALFKHVWLH